MDKGLLRRKDLDALISAMRATAVVYAPVRDDRGSVMFHEVDSALDVRLDGTNTLTSPKGLFFPQREILMRFSGAALTNADLPDGFFVVFGIRPCDASSLPWLDCVLCGGEQPDPYYQERRKNALVIAAACDRPGPGCFCTSVGGSPYGTAGADVLMSGAKEDDALLFEAVTEKGRQLLAANAQLFSPADAQATRGREERAEAARRSMKVMDLNGLKDKLDAGMDSPLWDSLTRTCLGCGVCAYICPACHCFDITDEKLGGDGVRVRSWDSCQFPRFTLHASGHNPRPLKKARMRQRVMHKFSYAVETAGTVFCSGCGRCVRSCPVDLDIRRILAAFKDLP
ncbi:MAG TPA: 4Fe-4S dicluster domain-containing protein [Spirochaetia bacterium]|nr:4Fe-4S dicluster domain-containing protein [Spirochaetia bacterium]